MTDLAEDLSHSFAYESLRHEFESTFGGNSNQTITTFYIISSMRIERYYASVKEEASKISDTASTLLNEGDYVGFFKACGPNYVRGIRRAQEVNAMFKYESTNTELAQDFAQSVAASTDSNSTSTKEKTKFNSITKTLEIKVKGYGLGLTEEGSETLMATSLEEFNNIMAFAYNLMTKAPNANHIGMVYGIEVVPWVENSLFQVAANLQSEAVEIPIIRSLLPRAYNESDPSDTNFSEADRDFFKCKNPAFFIDKYGYCCEAASLYDHSTQTYTPAPLNERICRPIRKLDKTIVKENLSSNGEFVARLDRALRYKSNTLATLQKCISSIRGYPPGLDSHYLKPHADQYNMDVAQLTVFDMKMAMDPFNDFAMVRHMGKEIDEFIDMFYAPCLGALFGSNAPPGVNPSNYMLAYPWYSHKECSYMSCLASGMRWDREGGGCIPGLMTGSDTKYPEGADAECSYDTEAGDATQQCKYPATELNSFQDQLEGCWNSTSNLQSGFAVEMFLTNYCMPNVSAKKMDATEFASRKNAIPQSCGGTQGLSQAPGIPTKKRPMSALEQFNAKRQQNGGRRRRR